MRVVSNRHNGYLTLTKRKYFLYFRKTGYQPQVRPRSRRVPLRVITCLTPGFGATPNARSPSSTPRPPQTHTTHTHTHTDNESRGSGLTREILTLGVHPVVACAALHHLAVVVVVLVALEADGAVVSWRERRSLLVPVGTALPRHAAP